MKKTPAYTIYTKPKVTNARGSYLAGTGGLCIGVTMMLRGAGDRFAYRQAEIEYPEDQFEVVSAGPGEYRGLNDTDGNAQSLSDLLEKGLILVREFDPVAPAREFRSLEELTGGGER